MSPPVVFQYQRALDQFRREGRERPLLKRMSELISLLDLTTTLSAGLPGSEVLDAALLIVLGELQAGRGALLVRTEAGFRVTAARGLAPGAPEEIAEGPETAVFRGAAASAEGPLEAFGFDVVCPVEKGGRVIALIGLGPRAEGRAYGEEEEAFLWSVAACAATPIENGLIHQELERVNQRLSLKVFQLRNLFEISRELTASLDEDEIRNLTTATLMGQLLASRCAVYLPGPGGLALVHGRGMRADADAAPVPEAAARPVLDGLSGAVDVASLPEGALRSRLAATRMALVVPLSTGGRAEGLVAVGERVSGKPFGEEDREIASTLVRQAAAALESVRLHRMRLEKQRQDRELQIAREIQQSLFPASWPDIPGFEVSAGSRSCHEVGGDHYDVIPLAGGRFALAIADVSGKGTPASILMASVHASLRALAGTTRPAGLMERLNGFLFESTQANKYVTLFYGELDPEEGELVYVNAGHVPPYHRRPDGGRARLTAGGPALGLLEGASFEEGCLRLHVGDVVAMVTDGATEAASPTEQEFGDEGVFAALDAGWRGTAGGALAGLFGAVDAWAGPAGCADDLTALVLKAL
ncbi:MAG: SpoIIE family protein phosphatase [Acidobacteria bacterium]|nr:SpoIIE family protein phosphatase [Acidobacteriota bacterium]